MMTWSARSMEIRGTSVDTSICTTWSRPRRVLLVFICIAGMKPSVLPLCAMCPSTPTSYNTSTTLTTHLLFFLFFRRPLSSYIHTGCSTDIGLEPVYDIKNQAWFCDDTITYDNCYISDSCAFGPGTLNYDDGTQVRTTVVMFVPASNPVFVCLDVCLFFFIVPDGLWCYYLQKHRLGIAAITQEKLSQQLLRAKSIRAALRIRVFPFLISTPTHGYVVTNGILDSSEKSRTRMRCS